jgi:hypothetical protein
VTDESGQRRERYKALQGNREIRDFIIRRRTVLSRELEIGGLADELEFEHDPKWGVGQMGQI